MQDEKILTLIMGVSGSGKSAIAQALAHGAEATVLTADTELFEGGREYDPSNWVRAQGKVIGACRALMESGAKWIVVDGTNLDTEHRAPFTQMAKKHGYTVQHLQIFTPLEVCIQRNKYRFKGRAVPKGTLRKQLKKLRAYRPGAADLDLKERPWRQRRN